MRSVIQTAKPFNMPFTKKTYKYLTTCLQKTRHFFTHFCLIHVHAYVQSFFLNNTIVTMLHPIYVMKFMKQGIKNACNIDVPIWHWRSGQRSKEGHHWVPRVWIPNTWQFNPSAQLHYYVPSIMEVWNGCCVYLQWSSIDTAFQLAPAHPPAMLAMTIPHDLNRLEQ